MFRYPEVANIRQVLKIVMVVAALALLLTPVAAALEDEGYETTTGENDEGGNNGDAIEEIAELSIDKDGNLMAEEEGQYEIVEVGQDVRMNSYAWDPTGEYALVVGDDGVIFRITIDGHVSFIPSGTDEDLEVVSWKPLDYETTGEGQLSSIDNYALILGGEGGVLKWDGTSIIHIMDDENGGIPRLEWSENGEFAFITSQDGRVFRYPPETNQVPFIVINEPVEGQEVSGTLTVHGISMDPDGAIYRVMVRIDDRDWRLADGTREWEYEADTTDLENGEHSFEARAYDGTEYSPITSVDFEVSRNLAPVVDITSPTAGEVVKDETLVEGTAFDPEGELDSVWLRVDDRIWMLVEGTSTWSFDLDLDYYGTGVHTISVMAFDGVHYSDVSSMAVVCGEEFLDPYVLILSPMDGRTYMTSETIDLRAVADEMGGPDVVYTWSSNHDGDLGQGAEIKTSLSKGDHEIVVTATREETEVTAKVEIVVQDDTDMTPEIRFLTPHDGSTVRGVVDVTGGAHDDGGIVAIKIRVDTGVWRTLSGSKVWHYPWDTTEVEDGLHTLQARAFDGRTWSDPVSLKVSVDNDKDPSIGDVDDGPLSPTGGDERTTGAPPSTDGIDGDTATAVAVTSFIVSLLALMTMVESVKVKVLGTLLIPLYSRIKKEKVLDNFTRGSIYGFIVANPGAHYNLIKQELGLNNGAIIYHLDILERKGFIRSQKSGIYKRYFQKDYKPRGGVMERLTDIQRRIVLEVKGNPGMSQKEMAEELNMSARALNYHVKSLLKVKLIKMERVGRKTLCFISEKAKKALAGGGGVGSGPAKASSS